jgi:hypothetical protein
VVLSYIPTAMLELSLSALLALTAPMINDADDDKLLTVAETSDYQATATYDEVMSLLDRLESASPVARRAEMGTTVEGRSIPLVIFADPPVATAAEACASGRTIVFVLANIHAGEVCGKEASLMLMRELATTRGHPWLEHLVLVFAPIYNADGNERFGPPEKNRPGQVGPARGMEQRPNAQGLDLNRDYVKLESPKARALVRFFTEWDPHLSIDTHTTNGSHHRYALTYDVPLNPSAHPAIAEHLRSDLLPVVTKRLAERTGYDTFYYGNFNRDHTAWATYSPQPRFGGPYQGLRGQMSILSEAYSYASYRDRVLCTREFVREIIDYAAEHHAKLRALHERVAAETTAAGADPQPSDTVGLRHRPAAHGRQVTILGYEMEPGEGRRPRPTDRPRDYKVVHLGRFEPTLSVPRPAAYIIPPELTAVIEKLDQHGIESRPFEGTCDVRQYRVTAIDRQQRTFQNHRLVQLEVEADRTRMTFPVGSRLVPTAQRLGTLAVYLLEPQSADGLVAWNFLDEHLAVGAPYPIVRVPFPEDLP